MKRHFLLLKTHNITGKKYLCYHFGTKKSCYEYNGSGKYWKNHLAKHGYDISTTILKYTNSREELKKYGLEFSKLFDIVKSKDFANLMVETCNSNRVIQRRNQFKNIERLNNKHFTEAELKNHKEISKRQLNKTMRERLNDPDWVHPNKGKSAKDIYGESYKGPWNKGKKWEGKHYNCKSFLITINGGEEIYCENEKQFFDLTKLNQNAIKILKKEGTYIVKKIKNSRHSFNNGDLIKLNYI